MAEIKELFPGAAVSEEDKGMTVKEVFDKTLEDHDLKLVVLLGITDKDEVMVTGNTTISQGVYLLEVGKNLLIGGNG